VLEEVTFGWPRQRGDLQFKEHLALRLQRAINWVVACSEYKQIFSYLLNRYILLLFLGLG
jgi:hypothetical protein